MFIQMKNKLKRILFTIAGVLFTIAIQSQQIGDGFASEINNFTVPLSSGCYNGLNPIGTLPENGWQHLLVVRHPNGTNNYQLQIASSLTTNDKLYFRKLASGAATSINPNWYELATRGTNNFIGNQTISGNIGIGTTAPNSKLTIRSGNTGVSIHPGNSPYFGTLAFNREAATGEIFDPTGQAFQINNGGADKNLHFQVYNNNGAQITDNALVISGTNGNIGIGTPSPNSKLTIKSGNTGTGVSIHPRVDSSYFGTLAFNREAATGEIFDPTGQAFQINNGGADKNLHFQVYNNNGAQITDNALVISGTNGNIGIGISNPTNKLDVNGTIHSREVKVDLTGWSDFVFKKEYDLPTLEEVEKHIAEKGHLENIPSEEDVLKNGINLGEMNTKLLQKIEELTLYTIEQNKKIQKLQEENKKFLDIEKRLEKIEKESK